MSLRRLLRTGHCMICDGRPRAAWPKSAFAPHVVEAILNHKSGTIRGVAAVYNRYSYATEKRAALDAWTRRLEAIVSGAAPSNVVELATARGVTRMRKTKTHKTKAKSLTLELNTLWPGVDSEKAGKLIRDFFQDFMSSPVGQFLSGKEDDVIDNLRRLKVQHGHALFRRIQNLPKDFTEADRKELMELANAATTDGMVIGALESGMRSGRDRRRKKP